jgi:c-di-GMP-binding flagellar brake protein YcgR
MKPRRVLAPHDASQIFDRAVQDRALAVLTIQDGREWLSFKSRFLERDRNGRFFVLDYQPVGPDPLPAVAPGQYVGVSFRQKSRKILFATVVEAKGHFVLDDQTTINAVRYRWPDSMTELQRRAYYRTPVPPEMTLQVTLWPGGITARDPDKPRGGYRASGELADISCGGALVTLPKSLPPDWGENDLIGVELQLPDNRPSIATDARHRGVRETPTGTIALAIQFVGLEMTPDGRLVLQRLANCVQRFHRLGIASGNRPAWGENEAI